MVSKKSDKRGRRKKKRVQRRGLNAHVDWLAVLDLLGVPVHRVAMPALVDCPACRGPATAMPDVADRGAWFWCRGCGFAGDSVELVAAAVGEPLEAAIRLLASHRIIRKPTAVAVTDYLENHVGIRHRLLALFEAAGANLPVDASEAAALVRDRIGFRGHGLPPDVWMERGGRLVGILSARELDASGLRRAELRSPERNRGRAWRESAIIPSWDLPGRPVGFYMFGRDCDLDLDLRENRLFNPSEFSKGAKGRRSEGGVAMLPAVLGPPCPVFGDAVFVMDAPVRAARLHLRHHGDEARPLPLLAYWRDGIHQPTAVWPFLAGRPITLIADRADATMLRVARDAGGRIFEAGSRRALLELLEGGPDAVLRHAAGRAEPWEVVLERTLARTPPRELGPLLERCGLEPRAAAVRFPRAATRVEPTVATIQWGERVYQEVEGAWVIRDKSDHIRELTDYALRVEAIGADPETGLVLHKGALTLRGGVHRYEERAETVLARPVNSWLARFATARGSASRPPGPLIHLIRLAYLFHPPRRVELITRMGWSRDRARFAFPGFHVLANGAVEPVEFDLPRWVPDLPFADLGPWGEADHRILRANPAGRAALRAVASGLLAPAFRQRPVKAALAGPGAAEALEAAEALGCRDFDPGSRHLVPGIVRGDPAAVRRGPAVAAFADPGAVPRGWTVFGAGAGGSGGDLPPLLLPAYIQNLAARRLTLERGESFAARVVRDVDRWIDGE